MNDPQDSEFDIRKDEVIRPGLERRMLNLSKGIIFTRYLDEDFWQHLQLLLRCDAGYVDAKGVRHYSYMASYKRPLVKRLLNYVTMLAKTARKLGSAALPDFTSLMITLDRHIILDHFTETEAASIARTLRSAIDRLWADNEIAEIENPETFYPPVPQEFFNEDDNCEGDPDIATMDSLENAEKLYRIRAKDFLPRESYGNTMIYPLRELREHIDSQSARLVGREHPKGVSLSTEELRLLRTVLRTSTDIWYEVYRYDEESGEGDGSEDGELVHESESTPAEEDHDRRELLRSIGSLLSAATAEANNPHKENRTLWMKAKILFDKHRGEFHEFAVEPDKEDDRDLEDFIRLLKTAARQLNDCEKLKSIDKAAPRKRGRKGSGLRGPRTECMDSQFKDFMEFIRTNPISEIGQGRTIAARARQFWAAHTKTFAHAAEAQGEKRGYSSANALASAYRASKS